MLTVNKKLRRRYDYADQADRDYERQQRKGTTVKAFSTKSNMLGAVSTGAIRVPLWVWLNHQYK